MSEKKYSYLLLLLASIIWGTQPSILKVLILELSPFTINFIRYIIICLILFPLIYLRKELNFPSKKHFLIFFLLGAFNAINNVLAFTGLAYSSAINSSIINTLTPVLTVLLSFLFLQEKISLLQVSGLFCSLFGAVYLVTKGSLESIFMLSFNIGDVYFMVAQLAWAIYTLICARMLLKTAILPLLAWSSLCSVLLMFAYNIFVNELYIHSLSMQSTLMLLYISVLGGCLGIFCWNFGVRGIGSSQSSIFFYIIPVVGVLCATLFLGESFSIAQIIGASCIFSGIFIITQHKHLMLWHKKR